MRKRIINVLFGMHCVALVCFFLYMTNAIFGNPLSFGLAKIGANRYLVENFPETDFQIDDVEHDFKTGTYIAYIYSPSSRDSYFTIHYDAFGQYRFDTYGSITDRTTTFSRLSHEYWNLVRETFATSGLQYSICFGELRAAGYYEVFNYTNSSGETKVYSLWKDYGLDMSTLILDGEYDIRKLGQDYGHICLYIHDQEITAERAAALLLEVRAFLDDQGLPFHAIDFTLGKPKNAEGQNVGPHIILYEFLYSDIYEEGLVDRVAYHWDLTQEHHALQDGLMNEPELITSYDYSP